MRNLLIICITLAVAGCGSQSTKFRAPKEDLSKVEYSTGSGDSYEDPVVITGVQTQSEGVQAEYRFISSKYGERYKDWSVVEQTIIREKDKVFDVIEIRLGSDSDRRIYYFEVTSFPWKKK
ncbi:MAG: hypothetical protein GX556_17855 [Fibrobacter sp.]|nr:hypothetical protein [Fibrobacter sp.]